MNSHTTFNPCRWKNETLKPSHHPSPRRRWKNEFGYLSPITGSSYDGSCSFFGTPAPRPPAHIHPRGRCLSPTHTPCRHPSQHPALPWRRACVYAYTCRVMFVYTYTSCVMSVVARDLCFTALTPAPQTGGTPPLPEGLGWFLILGVGAGFAVLTSTMTYLANMK